MRFSRGCLGVLSLTILLLMTSLCSVVAYAGMRGVVVDLWDRGSRVGSIGEVVQAVANPNAVAFATHAPGMGFTLPTLTAAPILPTSAPETVVNDPNLTPVTAAPTSETSLGDAPTAAPTQDAFISQKWEDPRQIRILLLGIDQRKGYEQETVFRSDTIILVNIDPVRKTVGVLSFPRDLWVTIPGAGQQRINEAMRQGDYIQYPGGGGPALAAETIAFNFGVRVDRYVVVNFNLFEGVVDTLAPEGVEVCVTEAIHDTHYPDVGFGFMEVKFDTGCQKLNGARLLQYARTRHGNSDFDRAVRQQKTLEAVRSQLLSTGGIARFATQIPALWNDLKDNYRTNLSLDEIVKLGNLMMEIPKENIRYATIDPGDVTFGKSEAGEDILIPIMSDIGTKIESVLYPQIGSGNAASLDTATGGNTVETGSSADLLTKMKAENATIYVYNGTDIGGLAGRMKEWLIGKGVMITTDPGNAASHASQPTVIRDYGGSGPNTALYLAQLLGIPADRVQPGVDGLVSSGVVIVIGPDVQSLLTSGQ